MIIDSKFQTANIPLIFSGITEGWLRITSRLFHNQECILKVILHMTSSITAQHFRNDLSPKMFQLATEHYPKKNRLRINF